MITTKKSLKSGLNMTELVEFKISGVLNTIQNTDDIKKKKQNQRRTKQCFNLCQAGIRQAVNREHEWEENIQLNNTKTFL